MTTYVLQTNYGVVIINADSPMEAWASLRKKEKAADCICLSHETGPEDFELLSTARGVVAYYTTG